MSCIFKKKIIFQLTFNQQNKKGKTKTLNLKEMKRNDKKNKQALLQGLKLLAGNKKR